MMGFLYLLESQNCTRPYLGSCIDVEKRLYEHNRGKNKSTKNKGPWRLLKCWSFKDISQARQAEYKIKKTKKKFSENFIDTWLESFSQ